MPRIIDCVSIQREVVSYIAVELGPGDIYKSMEGKRTRLTSIIKDAKETIVPTVSEATIRRWWAFFLYKVSCCRRRKLLARGKKMRIKKRDPGGCGKKFISYIPVKPKGFSAPSRVFENENISW